MKRVAIFIVVIAVTLLVAEQSTDARGGGGRSGGGFSGGGARVGGGPSFGGGARGPAGGMSGPSFGGRSPSFGGPSFGGGGFGGPGAGAGRPSFGAGQPGFGADSVGRPGDLSRPGGIGGARPSTGQLNSFLDVPHPSAGVGGFGGGGYGEGLRPGAGGAAGDFLRNENFRPAQLPSSAIGNRLPGVGTPGVGVPGVGVPGVGRPGVGVGAPGRPGQNFADNRPGRIENRQQWQGNRQERRDQVRDQVASNHPRFDFWQDHPNWAAWRINNPYRWATWGALTGWVAYGWGQPIAYDYGENVYYSNNQVYYGDQPVATADEYANQAAAIASSAPDVKPEDGDWMPLGVFALTQDGQATGTEPTLFMQLAISKQGIISGNLKNTATDQVQTLEGMADKQTQRVAWGVKDQQWPIIETGITNLTQDSSPALIHFADGQTQQWLMVRLEEPTQQ